MDIEHISVSRYQTWQQCMLAYKYKYHLKVISPEPEPVYFAYGTTIHKIAEEYVRAKGERPINEVANDVLGGKILLKENTAAPEFPQDYRSKIPSHLRAIKSLTDRIGYSGELEWKFHYDLDPPHKSFVTGFIDRLIPKGGKYFILDYKTTKKGPWRKNAQTIINDLQLRCYAKVVQREFGAKAEDIRAALYYLDGPELVSAKFSQDSLDRAEAELRDAYREIKSTAPENAQANYGNHCQRCDYRTICPIFNAVFPS